MNYGLRTLELCHLLPVVLRRMGWICSSFLLQVRCLNEYWSPALRRSADLSLAHGPWVRGEKERKKQMESKRRAPYSVGAGTFWYPFGEGTTVG